MTQPVCTVAVDVGNTAVKLAVRQDDRITHHGLPHDDAQWPLDAIAWVNQRLGCAETQWRISSVHRRAAQTLINTIEAKSQPDHPPTIRLIGYQDVPIDIAVPNPERLGIDRLLSSYAAIQLVRAGRLAQHAQSPTSCHGVVVVDVGSAITVDYVAFDPESRQGCFRGGAILPGLTLQARALATGTDALHEVNWKAGRPLSLPADNTGDAIYAGILVGAAAAVDSLALRYQHACRNESLGGSLAVVLTGGDASTLSPHLQIEHQVHQQLVCQGLLELETTI